MIVLPPLNICSCALLLVWYKSNPGKMIPLLLPVSPYPIEPPFAFAPRQRLSFSISEAKQQIGLLLLLSASPSPPSFSASAAAEKEGWPFALLPNRVFFCWGIREGRDTQAQKGGGGRREKGAFETSGRRSSGISVPPWIERRCTPSRATQKIGHEGGSGIRVSKAKESPLLKV